MFIIQETGRESISTSDHAHSSRDGRGSESGSVHGLGGDGDGSSGSSADEHAMYEEAFAKMKKAAGVSDVYEVVKRFETQEETTKHLQELQVKGFEKDCFS